MIALGETECCAPDGARTVVQHPCASGWVARSLSATSDSREARVARAPDSATKHISIVGPTVLLAVRRSIGRDTTQEATEALGDWSFYFARAAEFLAARGVRAETMVADTLRIQEDGHQSAVVVPEAAPLYYFAEPGHQPRSFLGFDSDADLIEAAGRFFWAGVVPRGHGDTLTPQSVIVDFVITRPTVIAFFSRRTLNLGRNAPAEYPDSARLVEQVASLRDTLDRNGVTLELTFKERFTVLVRGAVDTIAPAPSGATIGYYAANPQDWKTDFMVGLWPTPRLLSEINAYVHRLERAAADSR